MPTRSLKPLTAGAAPGSSPGKPPGLSAPRRSRSAAFLAALAWAGLLAPAPSAPGADSPETGSAEHFEAVIAPLLSRHCLECHDSISREGKVDLSRKETAFGENRRGKFIVPGDPSASLVWRSVESDAMPEDRPPLSQKEKALLREWINHGAPWHGDAIDPLAHVRDDRAANAWVQRLTRREYIATTRAATGIDISRDAERLLPPDTRADGFTNTAYNQTLDLSHIEAYARLAALVASRLEPGGFLGEHFPGGKADDKSLRQGIASAGRLLLRGPLEEHEQEAFLKVARGAREAGDAPEAIHRQVAEAMLQSPRFLYRVERQRGEGETRELSGHELAARMSYILWGAPPDRELARAADAGELADPAKAALQVERMLQDPRAIEQSARFIEEWLNLDRLEHMNPDPARFPRWTAELAADMKEETRAFFQEVAWTQKRPLADLLNAQLTYVTPRLAAHYGLDREASNGKPERPAGDNETPARASGGLVALYAFTEGEGGRVRDLSGNPDPADLKIADLKSVRWSGEGLEIRQPTLIATGQAPQRVHQALRQSGAVTLEAWITPADASQGGPARILTLSRDTGARNFTLGQAGDRFEVRFRAAGTSGNGEPAQFSSPGTVPAGRLVHVAYSRESSGDARLYLDGEPAGEQQAKGDLSNWDKNFRLALANEISRDRPWRGSYHLAAIYDRALSHAEIRQNHAAGPRPGGLPAAAPAPLAASPSPAPLAARPGAEGLEALYRFDEGEGDVVRDSSGHGEPLDLRIEKPGAIRWTSDGLQVKEPVVIASAGPARRLAAAARQSQAFTVEAVVTLPARPSKDLARVVSFSSGAGERNFTLGHDGGGFDFRLRSAKTDRNGMPGLKAPSPAGETRVHLVLTRDQVGKARFYLDGKERASGDFSGDMKDWSDGYRLMLANESTGDRPWTGTLHRVSLWSRALLPEEVRGADQQPVRLDLSDVPSRGGLLTQGSLLTAGGDDASMVARGLFVLHDLLGSGVTSAPPDADTTPVHAQPGMSRRAVAETRLSDRNCSGCHAKFEPLAFGLERFDGLGAYLETDEHQNATREDGEVHFPGEEKPAAYSTVAELMDLLAGHDRVRWNLTRKVTQFALGRPLSAADEPHLESIHRRSLAGGGTYASLATAIVLSDLVRQIPVEPLP